MLAISPIWALIAIAILVLGPIGLLILVIRAWPSSPTGDDLVNRRSSRIGGSDD